jgi:hypothetical protein
MGTLKFALQLYTVRDHLDKRADARGILEAPGAGGAEDVQHARWL